VYFVAYLLQSILVTFAIFPHKFDTGKKVELLILLRWLLLLTTPKLWQKANYLAMATNSVKLLSSGFHNITRSGTVPAALQQLQQACTMAGHWQTAEHSCYRRILPDEMVLLYCVSGRGWLRIGQQQKLPLLPGDLGFCPAQIVHDYGCEPDPGWEIYWLHCVGSRAAALFASAGLHAATPVYSIGKDAGLISAFDRLLACMQPLSSRTPWAAAAYLHEIALLLNRHRHEGPAIATTLADLVTSDCASLDELVARSSYSKYHFCRLFHSSDNSVRGFGYGKTVFS